MLYKTHLALGFLAGLFAIQFIHPKNQILFMIIVILASIFPDIDHPESKFGKWFKPIGWLFEHRGFFHSLLLLGIIDLLAYFYLGKYMMLIIAFNIGFLSHLIGDSITHMGIMPLHPFSKVKIRGFIKTGAFLETIIFFSLIILDAWKLWNL